MIPRRKTPGNDSNTQEIPAIDPQSVSKASTQVSIQEESQLFCFFFQQQLTKCFQDSFDNDIEDIWPGLKLPQSSAGGNPTGSKTHGATSTEGIFFQTLSFSNNKKY